MKRYLSISMLVIGSIIGAGFASGKELVSFFGNKISVWIAPVCGLGYFVFNIVFLYIGMKIKKNNVSEANKVIMGKFHFIADFFLLLNSLIVLSGMLAGMDSLFSIFLPIAPAFSVVSGIICAIIVVKGIGEVIKFSNMIVPVIIVFIFSLAFVNIDLPLSTSGEFNIYSLIIYIGMNLMLSSGFFVTLHDTDKKTIIISSLISSMILTLLMAMLIMALNQSGNVGGDIPVMNLCSGSTALKVITVIAIAISILTTMLTAMATLYAWINSYVKSKFFAISFTLIAGLIVSNLGFSNVVKYLYPIIGFAGIIYMFSCLIFVFKNIKLPSLFNDLFFHKSDRKIHKRSKNTQYNGGSHN